MEKPNPIDSLIALLMAANRLYKEANLLSRPRSKNPRNKKAKARAAAKKPTGNFAGKKSITPNYKVE